MERKGSVQKVCEKTLTQGEKKGERTSSEKSGDTIYAKRGEEECFPFGGVVGEGRKEAGVEIGFPPVHVG